MRAHGEGRFDCEMRRVGFTFSLLVLPALCGCAPVMVGGGAGFDAGTLGVSGLETGIGGHLEVIGYGRDRGFGPLFWTSSPWLKERFSYRDR